MSDIVERLRDPGVFVDRNEVAAEIKCLRESWEIHAKAAFDFEVKCEERDAEIEGLRERCAGITRENENWRRMALKEQDRANTIRAATIEECARALEKATRDWIHKHYIDAAQQMICIIRALKELK